MKKIERKVLSYLKERKWDTLRPGVVAKSIVIEGAELLEHFQWDNESLASVKKNMKKKAAVGGELADILIYCIELAVLLGLDTEELITDKLTLIEKKYPAKLMKGAPKGGSLYWKLKEQHRKTKEGL